MGHLLRLFRTKHVRNYNKLYELTQLILPISNICKNIQFRFQVASGHIEIFYPKINIRKAPASYDRIAN